MLCFNYTTYLVVCHSGRNLWHLPTSGNYFLPSALFNEISSALEGQPVKLCYLEKFKYCIVKESYYRFWVSLCLSIPIHRQHTLFSLHLRKLLVIVQQAWRRILHCSRRSSSPGESRAVLLWLLLRIQSLYLLFQQKCPQSSLHRRINGSLCHKGPQCKNDVEETLCMPLMSGEICCLVCYAAEDRLGSLMRKHCQL